MDGITQLREARGHEEVTFSNVADHFVDFVDRDPAAAEVVDRLARFLAEVERVRHDHDIDPDRGLAGVPESKVPDV